MTHADRILEIITAATPSGGVTFAEIARATGVRWQVANGRARGLMQNDLIIRTGDGRWIVNPSPKPKPSRHRSGARPRQSAKVEPRILAEQDTPAEMLRYAAALRRDYPVVPLKSGSWLVDTIEVQAADLVALARGEVRLRELRG